MLRPALILAAFALMGACATAPEPPAEALPPEIAAPTERYGPPIEERATALVAAEPAGAIPAGLQITILSVEETPAGLFYNAELSAPSRRRDDRDYVIYGQCLTSDLDSCASQIVSGARMLKD